ncbi:MAG: hypothetical protein WA240_08595 [Nitrospirota bacterium]
MGVYEEVKQALQDIVAPELRALQVEIKRLDEKIDSGLSRLDEKMDSGFSRLDEKIDSGFSRLDEKIDSMKNEVTTEIKRLDEKIDIAIQIRERLASLEAKVSAMSKGIVRTKIPIIRTFLLKSDKKIHTC